GTFEPSRQARTSSETQDFIVILLDWVANSGARSAQSWFFLRFRHPDDVVLGDQTGGRTHPRTVTIFAIRTGRLPSQKSYREVSSLSLSGRAGARLPPTIVDHRRRICGCRRPPARPGQCPRGAPQPTPAARR